MPLLHSSGQDLGLLGPSFGDDRIDGIARPTEQGIEEIGERVFVVRQIYDGYYPRSTISSVVRLHPRSGASMARPSKTMPPCELR
jgi:hypothetical protein